MFGTEGCANLLADFGHVQLSFLTVLYPSVESCVFAKMHSALIIIGFLPSYVGFLLACCVYFYFLYCNAAKFSKKIGRFLDCKV